MRHDKGRAFIAEILSIQGHSLYCNKIAGRFSPCDDEALDFPFFEMVERYMYSTIGGT